MARRRTMVVTTTDPSNGKQVIVYPNEDLPDWVNEDDMPQSIFSDEADRPSSDGGRYQEMTVPKLLAEAREREIELSSTRKHDIIEALEADDADND